MERDSLPPPQRVALAHAPVRMRAAWHAVIQFDLTLAGVVAQAREPVLRQLRLAWWRDALLSAADQRDPVLAELALHLPGHAELFRLAVDGWEELSAPDRLSDAALMRYAEGRASSFTAIGNLVGGGDPNAIRRAGIIWALGDFAAHASDPVERDVAQRCAADYLRTPIRLARAMRPLAILSALSRHALLNGAGGLLADRKAALLAMRVGIFGR